ncbi:TauD/TfdA family dioxygenase [Streptomyces sp. SCSIO 30461]|uniref:TauD/TfdA family dioxygenase n=1 Tax=Streptomyces sp. SCSIO 30461 TaxID=3118085 RepID=UPI0030D4E029
MSSSPPAPLLEAEVPAGKPPMLRVDNPGDATTWAARHRDALRATVAEHGALLVRGLGISDTTQAAGVFHVFAPELMDNKEAFAAREDYGRGVYSSATWPPNQPMCMHHELSYALTVPSLLMFACLKAPADGGATGVADAAEVCRALPAELVDRFARQGWLLDRCYNDEIGASAAEAFGTDDRSAIEEYCRANAIEYTWDEDGSLRTRQHRQAVVDHPADGRRCWFNQIAFLSEFTLAPEVREYLIDVYGADALPFTTRYGNGDPLDQDTVNLINSVYDAHTRREPWQDGDLMLVDNLRTAHSREAYEGDRSVLVAMAQPHPATSPEGHGGSAR